MIQYIIAACVLIILAVGGYIIHDRYEVQTGSTSFSNKEKSKRYKTSLHMAIIEKSSKQVENALAITGNINAQDEYGQTPLHYAAHFNRIDVAKLLLEHGADPNVKDDQGWRPLELIIFIPENEDMIALLEDITEPRKDGIDVTSE